MARLSLAEATAGTRPDRSPNLRQHPLHTNCTSHPMARLSLAEASRYQARLDTSKLWAMVLPNSSVPSWPSPSYAKGSTAHRGGASFKSRCMPSIIAAARQRGSLRAAEHDGSAGPALRRSALNSQAPLLLL